MADKLTDGTDADLGKEAVAYSKRTGKLRRTRLPDGTLAWVPIE
jgi:hypothetical protein